MWKTYLAKNLRKGHSRDPSGDDLWKTYLAKFLREINSRYRVDIAASPLGAGAKDSARRAAAHLGAGAMPPWILQPHPWVLFGLVWSLGKPCAVKQ